MRGRLMLGAALAYLVSPIQIIPNVIPVIGQTDDKFVLVVALRYAACHVPPSDVEAAWPGILATWIVFWAIRSLPIDARWRLHRQGRQSTLSGPPFLAL